MLLLELSIHPHMLAPSPPIKGIPLMPLLTPNSIKPNVIPKFTTAYANDLIRNDCPASTKTWVFSRLERFHPTIVTESCMGSCSVFTFVSQYHGSCKLMNGFEMKTVLAGEHLKFPEIGVTF